MVFVNENLIQSAVLIACSLVSISKAIKYKSRTWSLLSFFYGCWLIDDVYWMLYALFFDGETPTLSILSDLNWYAAYIFLYFLIRQVAPPYTRRETRVIPWLAFVFTFSMAAFYMQWGAVISNLIYANLIGLLLFSVIRRLMDLEDHGDILLLCAVSLFFVAFEYGLWTASCFWREDSLFNPYYWFDALMTLSFPFFIAATARAVRS